MPLQSGSPPFTPYLGSAPEGWELVLNFTPTGANFSGPSGIAIDASGNAWVANYNGNSVTELSSSGALVNAYNNTNTSGANFNDPTGIAIDASGNAWTGNYGGNSVTKLTSAGALAGNYDPSGSDFDLPQALAIDASGNAWVSNYGTSSVAEFIGGAGPVLTPLVACLTQASPAAVCLP